MLKRILGLLGWLGVALVFAAVAIRFLKPEYQQYYNGLAIAGLVCTLLYILSQWREIGQSFSGRAGAPRVARRRQRPGGARHPDRDQLSRARRYNKRWDLTAARQFSLSDQTKKVLQDLKEPVRIRVFASSDDFPRFRDRLDEYTYHSKQVTDRVHRSGEAAGRRAAVRRHLARHRRLRLQGTQREGHVGRRTGADQRH